MRLFPAFIIFPGKFRSASGKMSRILQPHLFLNPQAAGSVTGARLGRRCRLSSLTTAPETDILVGFSARALSPRGYSLRPWRVEFTLCPATLPLPGEPAELGPFSRIDNPSGRSQYEGKTKEDDKECFLPTPWLPSFCTDAPPSWFCWGSEESAWEVLSRVLLISWEQGPLPLWDGHWATPDLAFSLFPRVRIAPEGGRFSISAVFFPSVCGTLFRI